MLDPTFDAPAPLRGGLGSGSQNDPFPRVGLPDERVPALSAAQADVESAVAHALRAGRRLTPDLGGSATTGDFTTDIGGALDARPIRN